jgi:NAD(P)-dependent dehydrogenase (short-subunit alcohol dehydrogenase family)
MTQTIVITGAGQGIGRATALTFAAHGWRLHLVGRTAAKLDSTAERAQALGGDAITHPFDLTDSAALSAFAAGLGDATIDVLLNCAGEALIKPLADTTDAEWARILAINLTAPALLSRALLPHLQRSANASIINIGSMTAMKGFTGVTAYTAAKTGLLGFTRSLAAELRESVRVVMLAPGPADTPMRWAATPDYDPNLLITADTIAQAIWWLANLPRGTTTSEFLLQSVNFL